MTSKKPSLRELAALCAEVGADDGLDPKDLSRRARSEHPKPNHKVYQLCRQVERALSVEFAGDPRLLDLVVARVEPAPDSGRLLVTVTPGLDAPAVDETEASSLLASAGGHLRSAVAAAIHRKRTPELRFRYLPSTLDGEEERRA